MEAHTRPETPTAADQRSKVALLNDQFRATGVGGKTVVTRGVINLGNDTLIGVIKAMREYTTWNEDNDPYGEHDFGILTLANSQKVYFKIDYYDARMEFGSEDPADPEKTTRVLTLMLAEEY